MEFLKKLIVFSFLLVSLSIISMQQLNVGQAAAPKSKTAPSLKFITSSTILNKVDECKKLERDLPKLSPDVKQYLTKLEQLIARYKIFHKNGNIKEDPTQALFNATELGLLEIIPDLIALGADINGFWKTDQDGLTPLMIASGPYDFSIIGLQKFIIFQKSNLAQSTSLIDLLISLGADINLMSPIIGWTALHFASRNANLSGIQALIEHGASVNSKTKQEQETPLQIAIGHLTGNDAKKVILALINNNADINTQDSKGNTPLMNLIKRRYYIDDMDIIKLLLQHDVNLSLVNNQGQTAMQIAKDRGLSDIVKILTEHQEKTGSGN